jgi:phthalate 4,5-dioxygenase
MLSPEDNVLLTRIGPCTPMGDLIRQYWIPALMSTELPAPDGSPLRVRLLGENLIAFRTTSGSVGLLPHGCPHRGASLFFGRNEAEGIRCVYHGWKFDVAGRCMDMPTEPPDSTFKDKVRARAYPCQERNGIVWTYMGPRQDPPPLPDLEPNMLPNERVEVWTALRQCNWVQALEGDIDTAHLGLLHLGGVSPDQVTPGTFDYYTVYDRAPRYQVVETDYGTMYGAYRPAEEDTYYWRIAQFLFPFYTLIPTGELGVQILVRAWVPVDDHHTMFWSIGAPSTRRAPDGRRSTKNGQPFPGTTGRPEFLPNTTDWLGRWRLKADASKDYNIDREVQRTQSFTGIDGIHLQDQAITESMGPVVDRSQEHLGSSDAMIIRTRRRLMRAALDLRAGIAPPAVDHPELYRQRSGGVILPRAADWVEATETLRQAFVRHPVLAHQA